MTMHHQRLPITAQYVAVFPYDECKVRNLVGRFHAWLYDNHVDTAEIDPGHVDQFMQIPWARHLAVLTQARYRQLLHHHVRWLADGGYVNADENRPVMPSLPTTARQFIRELKTTLSPATTTLYGQMLRQWHLWVELEHIDGQRLTRNDVIAFSCMLQGRGLSAQTRGQYLALLRRYLFYLQDHGRLTGNPASLVRPSDFPKPPSLLPRALPPQVDTELRARLTASPHPRCRGFLLMRHTGLRVGELANLRFNCLHENHQGHPYLKVPLGKLKKERLVPLNDDALCLVRELREQGRPGRAWLIENPRTQKPFRTSTYGATLQSVRNGLPNNDGLAITSHRLRHSFATELLCAGLGLPAIKQLLGHRSIHMTLRYVTLTPNQLRDEYLAANAKAREQYGKVPEAPPRAEAPFDGSTAAATLDDIVRKVKRDAATLAEEQKPRARRAVRQLNNIAILLNELGL